MRLTYEDRVNHWFYGKGKVYDCSWIPGEVIIQFDHSTDGLQTKSVRKDSLQRVF